MRLVLTIVLVPLLFTILTGSAVGSAGGMVIGTGAALSAAEWAMMAAAGVIGVVAGKAIRLPAALVTGPIILSGAIHLVGWVEGGVPGWLIQIVQLFVGISLGIRFLGRSPIIIVAAAKVSAVAVFAVLCLAGVASALLSGLVGERWEAVFLAYAPGGPRRDDADRAVRFETSVIFVSLHHVLRIILTVVQIRLLAPRFRDLSLQTTSSTPATPGSDFSADLISGVIGQPSPSSISTSPKGTPSGEIRTSPRPLTAASSR